jgi:hypothetical protein
MKSLIYKASVGLFVLLIPLTSRTQSTAPAQPASPASWGAVPDGISYTGGNVGIGTPKPEFKLHVYQDVNSSAAGLWAENVNQGTGAGSYMGVRSGTIALNMYAFNPNYTERAGFASKAILYGGSAADALAIVASKPTGGIEFLTGGMDMTTNRRMTITSTGNVGVGTTGPEATLSVAGTIGLGTGTVIISSTAPIIASGFGATPSIAASNGTAAFLVNVGTGGTASSGIITMPAASGGWICRVDNRTALAANRADQRTAQTATTATSVTVQNQKISTGRALAWAASDVLAVLCIAY